MSGSKKSLMVLRQSSVGSPTLHTKQEIVLWACLLYYKNKLTRRGLLKIGTLWIVSRYCILERNWVAVKTKNWNLFKLSKIKNKVSEFQDLLPEIKKDEKSVCCNWLIKSTIFFFLPLWKNFTLAKVGNKRRRRGQIALTKKYKKVCGTCIN